MPTAADKVVDEALELLADARIGLVFQVQSGMLRIIAVANLHRQSDYWQNSA
jgi:hypothetical protein